MRLFPHSYPRSPYSRSVLMNNHQTAVSICRRTIGTSRFPRRTATPSTPPPNAQTRSHLVLSRNKSATPIEPLLGTTSLRTSSSAKPSATAIARPSHGELRNLFIASSIPMIGFGFMDNFVMIQAGQYIDSTLGVTLGLATLTAAAAGQVVSDVSGVVFGGTLERLLTRLALVPPITLSTAQRQLPISKNIAMLGAVCGVILGCSIGAVVGLFTADVAQREREQRDHEISKILIEMMRANSREWRLYLPQDTLVFDEADIKKSSHPQHRLDHQCGVGQLRPLDDDPLAQECLKSSSNSNDATLLHSETHGDDLYINVQGWAVLRCRPEDQREANQLARHMSILFHTLLRPKP